MDDINLQDMTYWSHLDLNEEFILNTDLGDYRESCQQAYYFVITHPLTYEEFYGVDVEDK